MKQEDITFLKELQQELNTQDRDCQASPRFWVVLDYRDVVCPEGFHDNVLIYSDNFDEPMHWDEAKEFFMESNLGESSDSESFLDLEPVGDVDDMLEWITQYYDKHAYLCFTREEAFKAPDTFFLTKQEARDHIKSNNYHYSSKAHTYAMTAWRAPKVEKLYDILMNADFDTIEK